MSGNFMHKAVERALDLLKTTKLPISDCDLEVLVTSTIRREFPNLTAQGARRMMDFADDELGKQNRLVRVMSDAADTAYRRDHDGAAVGKETAVEWFLKNCREEADAICLREAGPLENRNDN
jgi:hypothetical protein